MKSSKPLPGQGSPARKLPPEKKAAKKRNNDDDTTPAPDLALPQIFVDSVVYLVPLGIGLVQLNIFKRGVYLRGGKVTDDVRRATLLISNADRTHVEKAIEGDIPRGVACAHSDLIKESLRQGVLLPPAEFPLPMEVKPTVPKAPAPVSELPPRRVPSATMARKEPESAPVPSPPKRGVKRPASPNGDEEDEIVADEPAPKRPPVATASMTKASRSRSQTDDDEPGPPVSRRFLDDDDEEDPLPADMDFESILTAMKRDDKVAEKEHAQSLAEDAAKTESGVAPADQDSGSESDENYIAKRNAVRRIKSMTSQTGSNPPSGTNSEPSSPEKPKAGKRKAAQEFFACQKDPTILYNHNEHITKELEELVKVAHAEGDQWRDFTFRKVITLLKAQPRRIESGAEARRIPGIGEKTAQKIEEIIQTGRLRRVENYKNDDRTQTIGLFVSVWGIGPETARKLYNRGFRTLDDLRRHAHELNNQQQTTLQFHEELKQRIPRDEVQQIEDVVIRALASLDTSFVGVTCGSYRRGRPTCGDVDILITHPDGKSHENVLGALVPLLHEQGLLTHDLTNSHTDKYMGLCQLRPDLPHRRIDLKRFPAWEWGPALLYFTGSDHFNRSMRLWARRQGYSLNEHNLVRRFTKEIKSETPIMHLYSEEDVFAKLSLDYRTPQQRDV